MNLVELREDSGFYINPACIESVQIKKAVGENEYMATITFSSGNNKLIYGTQKDIINQLKLFNIKLSPGVFDDDME